MSAGGYVDSFVYDDTTDSDYSYYGNYRIFVPWSLAEYPDVTLTELFVELHLYDTCTEGVDGLTLNVVVVTPFADDYVFEQDISYGGADTITIDVPFGDT